MTEGRQGGCRVKSWKHIPQKRRTLQTEGKEIYQRKRRRFRIEFIVNESQKKTSEVHCFDEEGFRKDSGQMKYRALVVLCLGK